MQVSVEQTGALERRMEVSVPKERVEQAVHKRLQQVGRTAKLKGFRPGKAPLKVIQQQFGAQVRQEVVGDLMQSSFAEAITQHNLSPAAGPRIEPITMTPGEDLKYRAIFEVYPEVALASVEGLDVIRPVAEVTEGDIDAMVENLRSQRPKFETVERESREGDRVTMDFVGLLDGAEFEGSKGTDVAVLLGSGRMIKEFEAGITGMTAGEQRKIDVRYPDDYHNKSLAGRTANFDVHMKKVEEKRLPDLDDEFCREYGVQEGGMQQLRSEVAENMRRELATNVRARLRQQLLDKLLEANPVEVPQGLVDAQVREMQLDTARRIGAKDASQVPPADPFVAPARRRVALGILVGELIKTRGIALDRARVEDRLADIAGGYPDAESVLKAYRQNAEAMRQVENLVLEDQVVDYLLERAKVTDQAATFKDVMNFGA
ncbi:MAG TPA: trigger factor [Steroidobacteraceae bacterium]|nr:trigger factor [Steroidobacteraceae bacterium]